MFILHLRFTLIFQGEMTPFARIVSPTVRFLPLSVIFCLNSAGFEFQPLVV